MSSENYMKRALMLALLGRYTVSPNPKVGCIIVKNNKIISEGYHKKYGGPHAEINALNAAKESVQGADIYLTLEPCCHVGLTKPCVDALIKAKVKKVFIATLDPNPLVNGKSIQKLTKANIPVVVGLLEEEAKKINEIFFHYIKNARPFVILKWAMSLDGKTIVNKTDDRQISAKEAFLKTQEWRKEVDAILIGATTAMNDNPQLTVRKKNILLKKQPLRIILSAKSVLNKNLVLFSPKMRKGTILATTPKGYALNENLIKENNIQTWVIKENAESQVDLNLLLERCGHEKISSLLVEGGDTVRDQFIALKLVNRFAIYLCPVLIANFAKKQVISNVQYERLGNDLYLTGETNV